MSRTSTVPDSAAARITFRVLGAVFLLGGLASAITGGVRLSHLGEFESPGFADLGPLVIGMFAVVLSLGLLNAGFLGVQARYAANETSGAVRTVGRAWRDDDDRRGGRDGKFCSECGVRNDRGARFCDACGHGLG